MPSSNTARDVKWYKDRTGFHAVFADSMYAGLVRENLCIHLQWHADTENDPLPGGSVIRIYMKSLKPFFDEFAKRGTVDKTKFITNTPWGTNEFGFFDLNRNAIFVMEDI